MTLNPSKNPPTCNVETIFDPSFNEENPWWVARTKSRQEKALAWSFMKSGVKYFLPLSAQPQKNKSRFRISVIPLFPGYIFFRGTNQTRYEALVTGRIAQVIPVEDQISLNNELRSIALACVVEKNLELCDLVREGQRARIVFGPFAGVEGIVLDKKSRIRLILAVQAIGQAIRVEIGTDQLVLL